MLESSMQNSSSETVEKAFESMHYGRTMTQSILKKNQEVVVVQKSTNVKINGMQKIKIKN